MREALAAARQLALLTYDTVTMESRARVYDYYRWQRLVQDQARRVEKLTHALGIRESTE